MQKYILEILATVYLEQSKAMLDRSAHWLIAIWYLRNQQRKSVRSKSNLVTANKSYEESSTNMLLIVLL